MGIKAKLAEATKEWLAEHDPDLKPLKPSAKTRLAKLDGRRKARRQKRSQTFKEFNRQLLKSAT